MNETHQEKDWISNLPDDVIHRILSFLDAKEAVQTCVLSIRWKPVWTKLPFINLEYIPAVPKEVFARTVNQIFARRNSQCQVLTLKLHCDDVFTLRSVEKIVNYAIAHGVEELSVRSSDCKCSIFNSISLRKLTLVMDFDKPCFKFLNQWKLSTLHTLCLEQYRSSCYRRLPEICLSCLSSLTSLRLVRISLPISLDLPLLRTLILLGCELPENIWKLPCLITLELIDLHFPSNFSDFLSPLIRLENLRLISSFPVLKDCVISCPRLINLELKTTVMAASTLTPNICVLAPCISNISVSGIFFMTCGVLDLEEVNINLQDCILDKTHVPCEMLKQFYCRLFPMFSGLGGAKILRIDFDTFEALSTISNYLEFLPSPFHNLNYVKLPQGCKECSIPSTLRKYLLGGTQGAAVVTAMPRNIEKHQAMHLPQTSQKVILDEPLATPTKKLFDFQCVHKKGCTDTVLKRVQVQHLVDNSVVDAARVRQTGASVAGSCIDQASSSGATTDCWVSKGHQNIENQAVPLSKTSQKVKIDEPLATPTKKLIDYQYVHKKGCADTVEKRVQVQHLVENSVVHAARVRQAGASVERSCIDQASSSGGNADCWVWKDHQAVPVSLTSQKVMIDESLEILTKELVESQDMHKKVCVDTVETRVQVENMVDNFVVDAGRVRQVGSAVAGTCNVPVFKG